MKIKSKAFILIFLAFILIPISTSADIFSKQIEVTFRNIEIEIDRKEVKCESEPFILNNRVYVPLRAVIEGMGGVVKWENENNKVIIDSFKDFPDCNYLNGEHFVYGLVTAFDYEKRIITVEQHFDDNSIEVNSHLKIRDDVVIVLQRNDKKMNLEIDDLKVGEDIGLVLDSENLVRGIIIAH